MKRRLLAVVVLVSAALAPQRVHAADKPNVLFLIADDLGVGDLGSYGQKKIRTPNLDRLAAEGMRFTQGYSGHNVCAPSRCVLMSGKHPGHAFIRDNRQAKSVDPKYDEGQIPVPAGELRLPLLFAQAGYTIGGFGKWGLGPVGSTGDPLKQGFSRFYGYNCQAVAHNYYPTHLWDDDKRIALEGNPPFPSDNPPFLPEIKLPADADVNDPATYARFTAGKQYAPDLITEQALKFLRENKDKPFLLYYPTTVPHLALQVPDDSLREYENDPAFKDDPPYVGGEGYLPHRKPHAAYAAMVTRMDREIGRLLTLVKELGLDERTIVVFVSDNGPLWDRAGGTDTDFFNSNAGLRGRKGTNYEGGIRIPFLVRWTGKVAAGSTSDRVVGFEDFLPTLLELTVEKELVPTDGLDGVSFAPTLLGTATQPPRDFLYRESPGYGGTQSVRVGDWKAIRNNLHPRPRDKDQKPGAIELFDLAKDPAETTDLANQHPDVIGKLRAIMEREHVPSKLFPIRALDK
jgi:arylsulfatase A-like enzyme